MRKEDGGINVIITECDGTSIPLASFRRVVGSVDQGIINVYVSNQLFGEMTEVRVRVLDSCIRLQLNSNNCGFMGMIDGLSIEDVQQLKSNEIGDPQIRRYFLGEDVLSSPNATFTPQSFMMSLEDGHHGIIKSACLLQMSTINPMEGQIQAKEKLIISMKDQLKEMQEVEAEILEQRERTKQRWH